MRIIPVECKSGGNVASASFKRYRREEKPELAIRFSPLEYKEQDDMINLPLYLAGRIGLLTKNTPSFHPKHAEF